MNKAARGMSEDMPLLCFSRMQQTCDSVAFCEQQEVLADCAWLSSSVSNPVPALSGGDSHDILSSKSIKKERETGIEKRKMGGYMGTGKANGALVRC